MATTLELLYVTNVRPLEGADGGASVQYRLLQTLARYIRVTVMTITRTSTSHGHIELRRWLDDGPMTEDSGLIAAVVDAAIRRMRPDVLDVAIFQQGPTYVPPLRMMSSVGGASVCSFHDVPTRTVMRRLQYEMRSAELEDRLRVLGKAEKSCSSRFDGAIVIPKDEYAHIRRVFGGKPTHRVSVATAKAYRLSSGAWRGVLVFVGAASHGPNCDAVTSFIGMAADAPTSMRGLKLRIVGNWPDGVRTALSAAAQRSGIQIEFTGYVQDLRDVVRDCVGLVPVRTGSGVRVKMVDLMSLGIPIVCTQLAAAALAFDRRHGVFAYATLTALRGALAALCEPKTYGEASRRAVAATTRACATERVAAETLRAYARALQYRGEHEKARLARTIAARALEERNE